MRTRDLLILLVAAVTTAAGAVEAQATRPSSPPAPAVVTPPGMIPVIKAIREANTVAAAAEAFAEGAEMDRDNVYLNAAYMRRLLQLGQPGWAGAPAARLARALANDGTAYGVMGYTCGGENHLSDALAYTLKAANLVKDDNSIQSNLGQLVAWYECAKPGKLPAADEKTLEALKADLASTEAYQAAYKTIKDAYDKHAADAAAHQAAIASAQTSVDGAAKRASDAQAQVNRLIRQTDDAGAIQAAQKRLQDAKTALAQRVQALDDLRRQPAETQVPLRTLFQWLPPAVDGVVTLPADAKRRPTTTSAPTSTSTSAPASAPVH